MANFSKRSLKASKEGVQLASRAILRFPTKIDFAVELEISRSTVQNFFAGKPIGRENFHKICQELDLRWEEVAELPQKSNLSMLQHNSVKVDLIDQKADSKPIQTTVDFSISEYRLQIQSRIVSTCSTMRVLDMSQPMNVKDIYVDAKVYEKIKGRRRLEVGDMNTSHIINRSDPFNIKSNLQEVRKNEIFGLEAATRYPKLVILGKPGSGKTMFLKHLMLECLEGKFEPHRIPIFVSFRDLLEFDASLDLLKYITLQITKDCQPTEINLVRQLLAYGNFFIAIDGLDEVKTSDRRSICQYLRRFVEWFPDNRYIISCRHGVEYCNFEQFTEVEVADFQFNQISNFASKWFEIKNIKKSFNFLKKLEENSSIKEFSTNPLLLTLLCILFEESLDFPSSRSEIYEEGLDILLKQWDAERSIEREEGDGLSQQQEKELLCAIALNTFENKRYFFKETELEFYINNYVKNLSSSVVQKVNAKKIIKSIEARHGLLVEQAKKVYSFSDLAFQEYLTARKFVFEYDLEVSMSMLNHLVSHMTEDRWHEIFLLVAEMSFQANELFKLMNYQVQSQIASSPNIKAFLSWVSCKAESTTTQRSKNYDENLSSNEEAYAQKLYDANFEQDRLQSTIMRAFYFCIGFSQISGRIGSDFNLALNLNPNFSSTIHSDLDMALDLSLSHVLNLIRNLESIRCPASTLQRTLKRAIAYAIKMKSELAQELQEIVQKLPLREDEKAQFWLWWHEQGEAWSGSVSSAAIKYRNIGYQWELNPLEQVLLKQYYQANLLLVTCLERSSHASLEVKQAIKHKLLLPSAEDEETQSEQIESILYQTLV
jgi:predicted NACHT family NTPase